MVEVLILSFLLTPINSTIFLFIVPLDVTLDLGASPVMKAIYWFLSLCPPLSSLQDSLPFPLALLFHLILPLLWSVLEIHKLSHSLIIALNGTKITWFSQASPSYFSKKFSTQEQENNLYRYFIERELHTSLYLDEELFKDFFFVKAFNNDGLRRFIFEIPREW